MAGWAVKGLEGGGEGAGVGWFLKENREGLFGVFVGEDLVGLGRDWKREIGFSMCWRLGYGV